MKVYDQLLGYSHRTAPLAACLAVRRTNAAVSHHAAPVYPTAGFLAPTPAGADDDAPVAAAPAAAAASLKVTPAAAACDRMLRSSSAPSIVTARSTAYGYDAWKRSKFSSPVNAIPSNVMRALVINAKYSGTWKG